MWKMDSEWLNVIQCVSLYFPFLNIEIIHCLTLFPELKTDSNYAVWLCFSGLVFVSVSDFRKAEAGTQSLSSNVNIEKNNEEQLQSAFLKGGDVNF